MNCSISALSLSLLAAALQLTALAANAADEVPYLGHWSNGRGETLVITEKAIRFAEDKPVPYRDVTRATDGSMFELQIVARGAVNTFSGKTLAVSVEGDSMQMTGYLSHADFVQGKDPQQEVTWERDDDDDDEDEEAPGEGPGLTSMSALQPAR